MRSSAFVVLVTLVSFGALGGLSCSEPKAPDARYPVRPENCDVQLFHESPPMQTDSLGTVTSTCGDDISDEDCLRTLKNEACKLGGDVVWGVADAPQIDQAGKKHFSGRAAHMKGVIAKPPPPVPPG